MENIGKLSTRCLNSSSKSSRQELRGPITQGQDELCGRACRYPDEKKRYPEEDDRPALVIRLFPLPTPTPLHILMLIFLLLKIVEVCGECNLQCIFFSWRGFTPEDAHSLSFFSLFYNLRTKESTGLLCSTGIAPSTKESSLFFFFFIFGSFSGVSGDKVLRQEAGVCR